MNARYGLAFVWLLATLSPASGREPSGSLLVDKDIVFGRTGEVELKLDLYRLEAHANDPSSVQPAIVVIFGGGFRVGNKEMVRMFCEQYARAGYVAAAVSYRLLPDFHFPAPVEDVKCAVRWLRASAEKYRVDDAKIGAMGISAGGYLAMMLGYLDDSDGFQGDGGRAQYSSKVQAVVNYAGAFDLTMQDWDPRHDKVIAEFVLGPFDSLADDPFGKFPRQYQQASPAQYVDKNDAPTLHIQGTRDTVVPYGQAVLAHTRLIDAGVLSRLKLVEGAGHGWWGKQLQETQKQSIEFFDEQLGLGRRAAAP